MHNKLHKIFTALTILVSLTVAGSVWAWNFTQPAQDVKPANGAFNFPADMFKDGKAKHFQYTAADGQKIRFFVVQDATGKLRAALDACEVCFKAKKGYIQQGSDMICVNCGQKFKVDKVGDFKGGCNPHPLKIQVAGDGAVITEADVAAGARYFQ
jgi:uncharacterized membrane protein